MSGPTVAQAVASADNARTFWTSVGCNSLFDKINVWWFQLDDYPTSPNPAFGVVGTAVTTTPLFDLSCPSTTLVPSSLPSLRSSSTPASGATSGALSTVEDKNLTPTPGSIVDSGSTAPPSGVISQIPDGQIQAPGPATSVSINQQQSQATPKPSINQVSSHSNAQQSPTSSSGQSAYASASKQLLSESIITETTTKITQVVRVVTMTRPSNYASSTSAASSTPSACPASLGAPGSWLFPRLIIPVSKSQPKVALGTQYNATLTADIATTFTFDIPAQYAGKTCSLIFLFPAKSQLQFSSFSISGYGSIDVFELSKAVDETLTYASLSSGIKLGSIVGPTPANDWVITSHSCGAGQSVSFEFAATGDLALEYFQDFNPSPIGAYISVC